MLTLGHSQHGRSVAGRDRPLGDSRSASNSAADLPSMAGSAVRGARGLQGGLVKETGIALVHQGEMILPAAGSEASVMPVPLVTGGQVYIDLPVVVEVVGQSEAWVERTVNETLRRLRLAIDAQQMGV